MSADENMCVGDLELRPREHVVLIDGTDVPLSSREFDIMRLLVEHPGWVYSAGQLSAAAEQGDYSPESVSVLVSRLRHKLTKAGAASVIETVRGAGYRLHSARVPCDDDATEPGVNRELRDALWMLQEAVMEAEHTGTADQQHHATQALEDARRSIFARLAE